MKKISLAEYNLQTRFFWWSMIVANLLIFGAAIYGLFSFSLAQLAALPVALVIAAIVNQHQFTVPRTRINFTGREIIIFWAIIWLGIPGGVLIAAGVFAEHYKNDSKDKMARLYGGLSGVISAFAAANVFYFVLKSGAGFTGSRIVDNTPAIGWIALAITAMAITHCLFSELMNLVFFRLENDSLILEFRRETIVSSLEKYAVSIVAAFVFHLTFLEFGLYFGLVLLPISIVAHLAYRLHITRFEQKTKEISEASRIHLATVEALATAIDARDQVGIGHVRRTQIYAVGIGEILGLSEADLHALNTGALLHDIGKLAVPDHILNKPGKLTPAEMEKMKIHASVGASILEKIQFNYPVVPTVKYHHETWDGNGYPEGLKGENIPLTARILAVADTYDSLRGARPYRAAISRDEARRFLLNGAGKQFDPKIVDVFLRNARDFEAQAEAQGYSYAFDNRNAKDLHTTIDDDSDQNYVEQIKRANREVFTLYELARVFSSSLNMQETLSLFANKIGELVPFDTCAVYLTGESEDAAKAVYIQGEHKTEMQDKQIKAGEGATGFVLKNRVSLHRVDPGLDFTLSEFDFGQDYTAMASLPLMADGKLLGAVSLYSFELENYEEEHMRLLETVTLIASDAISKSLKHAESESRALTDPMTNLPNARSLQYQFEKEAARASRNGSTCHLLMLDLDGFKAVNDTFGHKVGDKLLKELAVVMTEQLRDYDFLARYAGDEFVALAPETNDEGVRELCQRIEKAVNEFALPLGDGKHARVGVSIGIGCFPNHGSTLDQILIAADKAMYSVKAKHKQIKNNQTASASDADGADESFIVELDESHVISSAIN